MANAFSSAEAQITRSAPSPAVWRRLLLAKPRDAPAPLPVGSSPVPLPPLWHSGSPTGNELTTVKPCFLVGVLLRVGREPRCPEAAPHYPGAQSRTRLLSQGGQQGVPAWVFSLPCPSLASPYLCGPPASDGNHRWPVARMFCPRPSRVWCSPYGLHTPTATWPGAAPACGRRSASSPGGGTYTQQGRGLSPNRLCLVAQPEPSRDDVASEMFVSFPLELRLPARLDLIALVQGPAVGTK